tara:strand:+ start:169 stop:396 length:228 start_codon:yes stop_codon:yes gene_type:complete
MEYIIMENASKEILLGSLVELLNDNDFKQDFVRKVNENVDIPIINEKTEKKVINTLYKLMVDQVETAIEKIQKQD